MEYILRTQDVYKKYGKNNVLNGVTMNVEKGDIYGFVGENGSGKTTVIRLICGLIFADSGEIELFGKKGKDLVDARKKVGAIVETPSIYKNFSAYDNLKMQCGLLGIKDEEKIKTALNYVGLDYLYDDKKKSGDFSLGMRQRLGIAMALLGEPEFLILDEPMNGLDPQGIVEIRELIIRLNKEKNITFLISSHILTELQLVATKYGIISKGRVIKEITADQLHNECRRTTYIESDTPRELSNILIEIVDRKDLSFTPTGVKIYGELDLNFILQAILSKGVKISAITCNDTNFEEYYLSVIRGAL